MRKANSYGLEWRTEGVDMAATPARITTATTTQAVIQGDLRSMPISNIPYLFRV
jgi:hypothetical protein